MALVKWNFLHPQMTMAHLGHLPLWLDTDNPKSAREQLGEGYIVGGGWRPFSGHILGFGDDYKLYYPGDPPMEPLAIAKLRDELIVFYQSSWVAVIQADRSFEVCRMD